MNVDNSVEARSDLVLPSVEDRGVRFVRRWLVDLLGILKSKVDGPFERRRYLRL